VEGGEKGTKDANAMMRIMSEQTLGTCTISLKAAVLLGLISGWALVKKKNFGDR
jgi:ABC-type sulfate transport system permease component